MFFSSGIKLQIFLQTQIIYILGQASQGDLAVFQKNEETNNRELSKFLYLFRKV
jgi:hypothetical protein